MNATEDAPGKDLAFPKIGSVWRHRKGGGVYTVRGLCLIEATLNPGVIYEGGHGFHADGRTWTTWVRPLSEFMDGRFEAVAGSNLEQRQDAHEDCYQYGSRP